MFLSDEEIARNGYIFKNLYLWKDGQKIYFVISGEISGMNVEKIEVKK